MTVFTTAKSDTRRWWIQYILHRILEWRRIHQDGAITADGQIHKPAFKSLIYTVQLQRPAQFLSPAILACAASTVDFNTEITFSGSAALKIAVPATITLLPVECIVNNNWSQIFERVPASAQTPIVWGPTPPSTSISLSGNRDLSSETFGTHRSKNFWPPRPETSGRNGDRL